MPSRKKKKTKPSAKKEPSHYQENVEADINQATSPSGVTTKAEDKSIVVSRECLAHMRFCLFCLGGNDPRLFRLPRTIFISAEMLKFLLKNDSSLKKIFLFLVEQNCSVEDEDEDEDEKIVGGGAFHQFSEFLYDVAKIRGHIIDKQDINKLQLKKSLTFQRIGHVLSDTIKELCEIREKLEKEIADCCDELENQEKYSKCHARIDRIMNHDVKELQALITAGENQYQRADKYIAYLKTTLSVFESYPMSGEIENKKFDELTRPYLAKFGKC